MIWLRQDAALWDQISRDLLDDLVAGIGRILAGELVGREEKTFVGDDGLHCDFDSCGIVYRSDRLGE